MKISNERFHSFRFDTQTIQTFAELRVLDSKPKTVEATKKVKFANAD